MALPKFTMRNLLEAGVHFGHHPRRWNPKMEPFLYGVRNSVHIINLEKTVPRLHHAIKAVHDVVMSGGRVLFVGTKPQASSIIAEYATRAGQYYVNHRWLGGMMTNWKTVSKSISRMKEYEEILADENNGLTKKETLQLNRNFEKLERALGGIREMGGTPDLLFVVDTNREVTAVKEANKMGIPVVGIVDSNADPSDITFPIPGNDDAQRSIRLFCELVSGAVLEGIQTQMSAAGIDIGDSAEGPVEDIDLTATAEEKPAKKKAAPKKAAAKKDEAKEEKPKKAAAPKKAKAEAAEEPAKKAPAKKAAAKKADETEPAKKAPAKKATAKKADDAADAKAEKKPAAKKTTAKKKEEEPAK